MAYGPVVFDAESGWDTEIQVQNLSRTRQAHVRVAFLDDRGAPVHVLDDYITAAGAQRFFVPILAIHPERRIGSVRVVSQPLRGDPAVEAAPIAAVAEMYADAQWWRAARIAAGAYPLLNEREALARFPGAAGGTQSGIGAVALPGVMRAGAGVEATTELAISNVVPAPGWTDVAVMLHDANGLVDVICRRIGASSTITLDLADLPALTGSFQGGALVSATAWHHPVGGTGRGPERNLVGLGAVAITEGSDTSGDEMAIVEGVPLAHVPAALGGDAIVRCQAPGALTPPAPATATSSTPAIPTVPPVTATPSYAFRVFLPIVTIP